MMHDGSPEYGRGKHVDERFNQMTTFRGGETLNQMLNTQALNALYNSETNEDHG